MPGFELGSPGPEADDKPMLPMLPLIGKSLLIHYSLLKIYISVFIKCAKVGRRMDGYKVFLLNAISNFVRPVFMTLYFT